MSRKGGAFTIIGISSFGVSCDEHPTTAVPEDIDLDYEEEALPPAPATSSNKPKFGVYTNVSNYVDWIMQNSDYSGCKRRTFLINRPLHIST